jgi:predicted transcriptional regulator
MDRIRSISCSMIFEVLLRLSEGPQTLEGLSKACRLRPEYVETVVSSATSGGLVKRRAGAYQLTKKGARTAIYLLVIHECADLHKDDYRAILQALNRTIEADAPAA